MVDWYRTLIFIYFSIQVDTTTRTRIVRTALYNTTRPAITKSTTTTTTTTDVHLTTPSSRSTTTRTSMMPTFRVHVQLITNIPNVNSTTSIAHTIHTEIKDISDTTNDSVWPAIVTSGVAVLICVGILLICYRKQKRGGTKITTNDQQGAWTTTQTNTAKYSAKDQIVVLPLCDIKTATVLHDTRIYPTENKWLIPGHYETPVPYNSMATPFEEHAHGDDGEEEGTLTNAGYEDDDYIHSIFQRFHDGAMEEGSAHAHAQTAARSTNLSDHGVKSEKSSESEYNTLNPNATNQHRFDYSHVDMKKNTLDDDTYSKLHGNVRRFSGEATYSHLYDSWLDRHQRKGEHAANEHNVPHTNTRRHPGDMYIDEESGLY